MSERSRSQLLSRVSIGHVWSVTVVGGIFAFLNTHPIRPQDFWWHVKAGEIIALTGRIPASDSFSFVATGQPYAYTSYWLMEWTLYQLYTLGGAPLVVFANALLITGAYIVLLATCCAQSGNWRHAAYAVLLAAALGIDNWNVRPQTAAILLFSLLQAALVAYDHSKQKAQHAPLWLLIPPTAMLIWVNSHGSFPLGLVLLTLWVLESGWNGWRAGAPVLRSVRTPLAILLISSLAILANPRGLGIVAYLRELLGDPAVQSLVTEWAPTSAATLSGKLFFAGMLITIGVLIAAPARANLIALARLTIFAVLALMSQRHILWAGMVAALAIGPSMRAIAAARVPHTTQGEHPGLNAVIAGSLIGISLLTLPWLKSSLPLPPSKAGLISAETPVDLAQAMLAADWPQPLFNDQDFGSYLIWATYPAYRVFIDPRIDLYPLAHWLDYLAIAGARYDWETIVDRYHIETLVLSSERQPQLIRAADVSGSWKRIYQDPLAVVFTREPPATTGALPYTDTVRRNTDG